jgi:hypothetical protein
MSPTSPLQLGAVTRKVSNHLFDAAAALPAGCLSALPRELVPLESGDGYYSEAAP